MSMSLLVQSLDLVQMPMYLSNSMEIKIRQVYFFVPNFRYHMSIAWIMIAENNYWWFRIKNSHVVQLLRITQSEIWYGSCRQDSTEVVFDVFWQVWSRAWWWVCAGSCQHWRTAKNCVSVGTFTETSRRVGWRGFLSRVFSIYALLIITEII